MDTDQASTVPAAAAADESPSKKPSSSSGAPPSKKSESATTPAAPPDGAGGGGEVGDEDDMLLVTEFPPPPYYYTLASRQTPSNLRLTPPEIPHRAFRVAAKRVALERQKAREESERIRLEAEREIGADGGGGGSGRGGKGENGDAMEVDKQSADKTDEETTIKSEEDDDSIVPNDPNEPVVAVFGEIVEDPTLVVEEECHDPVVIRENVKGLNRSVLTGFLQLVDKLVNDPNDNKKLRDELSHNLFLMLQECNKFREHQAREILIGTLEQQLERKKMGLEMLQKQIGEADDALVALKKFRESS